MANFTWINTGGGDWSNVANWSRGGVVPVLRTPNFAIDTASFDDLATSYTVTINAGTTVGSSATGGPLIEVDATSASKDVAFSIGGTLNADFIFYTGEGDPATTIMVEAGGSLIAPTLLYSVNVFET